MNALLLHWRMRPLKWLPLVLLAIQLTVLFWRFDLWKGLWGETGANGMASVLYTGGIAAAAAAWTVSLRRKDAEINEQLTCSPKAAWQAELPRMAALVVGVLGAYLAGQAVAFAVTATSWPAGIGLYLGYVALGMAALIIACAWGWALGMLFNQAWGPALAILGWLASYLALGSNLVVIQGPARWEVVPWAPALYALAACALLALCLRLTWFEEAPRRRFALRAGLLAGGLALSAAVTSVPAVADRDPEGQARCIGVKDVETLVCLWPEEEKYYPMAIEVLDRLAATDVGLTDAKRVYSYGHLYDERNHWYYGDFDLDNGSQWEIADGLAAATLEATFAGCDSDPDDLTPSKLESWLEKRLAGGGKTPYTIEGARKEILAAIKDGRTAADLPEREQSEWARSLITAYKSRHCD
ncbi:hypothetical protein ACFU8W_49110 [Streptomyces sp. NPDC057565]|uniref:hypothetical protein n=1 Tax=Streptomyces sp. NPDC057565 TaxID=3346169 RepID=UPI00367F5ABC